MAAEGVVTLEVRFAWWLHWYLAGVEFMSAITGLDPDWQKVEHTVRRSMRLYCDGKRVA
jgi:hypothetical protein